MEAVGNLYCSFLMLVLLTASQCFYAQTVLFYVATRSRRLVHTLHNLGMCVSYDRLLQLSSDNKWDQPTFSDIRCCVSIKFAAKSLDYSNSQQHRPQPKLCNRQRFLPCDRHISNSTSMAHSWWPGSRSCRVESRSSKPTTHLPSTYTRVAPVALRAKNFNVPMVQGPIRLTNILATAAEKEEDGWLNW